jgi:hypothetical protein
MYCCILEYRRKREYKPAKEGAQHVVHQALECCRRFCQAEGHDEELDVAMVGAEGGLLDVRGVNPDLVVAGAKVELGEKLGTSEFIQKFIHDQNRVLVLDRLVIERTVINTKLPPIVLLLDEDRCREGRRARADYPLCEHDGALAFQLILLKLGVTIW